MKLNVLIVEEDGPAREKLGDDLRKSGHRIFAFGGARSAAEAAQSTSFDFAVLSFADPQACLELKDMLKTKNPACQVTLLTERPLEPNDAMAMEAGARSVLFRPVAPGDIQAMIGKVAFSRQRRAPYTPAVDRLAPILGQSDAIARLRDLIDKVAVAGGTSVLITGESGTGKELVARALHRGSPRALEAFLEVNCAAIPESLLESELFGHEMGAFTDAHRAKPGLFELADRGTLFLDEIGEMNLDLQAKLLRAIDTRTVRRIAGEELIHLDVRIVAATNRDLASEVGRRRFRDDLYHRLNVIHIHMPPLRDREGDIRLLADHFLDVFARKFGKDRPDMTDGAWKLLENYPWPGNIRELANQIERAVLLTQRRVLEADDFPLLARGSSQPAARVAAGGIQIDFAEGPVPLESVERELVARALEAAGGNVSEAARLLQVGRGALRYKIERHKLARRALVG